MYFPSESWGRMHSDKDSAAFDIDAHSLDYLIQLGQKMDYLIRLGQKMNAFHLDDSIVFNGDRFVNSKCFLREILEECIMPLLNPKTGEEDYVDTSKIGQILIDTQNLFDLQDQSTYEISLKLRYDQEKEKVALIGRSKFLEEPMKIYFSLELLERLLQEAIFSEEEKQLEDFEEFKDIIYCLLEDVIKEGKKQKKQLIKFDQVYSKNEGLGIIMDSRTKHEVGTFEKLDISVEDSKLKMKGFHIITQGKFLSQIKESPNDYHYIFYSLSDHKIYDFSTSQNINIEEGKHESKSLFTIEGPELYITDFDETNFKYPMIQQAQEKKQLIQELDLQDVLNEMAYEQFKSTRLEILAESRERAKKEAIYNQFSDIELEL